MRRLWQVVLGQAPSEFVSMLGLQEGDVVRIAISGAGVSESGYAVHHLCNVRERGLPLDVLGPLPFSFPRLCACVCVGRAQGACSGGSQVLGSSRHRRDRRLLVSHCVPRPYGSQWRRPRHQCGGPGGGSCSPWGRTPVLRTVFCSPCPRLPLHALLHVWVTPFLVFVLVSSTCPHTPPPPHPPHTHT